MGIANPSLLPHWHPNQLRHSAATMIRKEFGLEAAGHFGPQSGRRDADLCRNGRQAGDRGS